MVWLWVAFTLFIIFMLALDLGVFQRRPHVIGMREALAWFGFWTGLAFVFNIGILLFHANGAQAGIEFLTGYLVEKSLSIDNIFVFILIFNYFHVPPAYQHKVLFWGIVGAIVLRIFFIVVGLSLLEQFHWMSYLFGGFLLATGITMMVRKEVAYDPGQNWVIRVFRRLFPVTDRYENNQFFVRRDSRLYATPLFIVLLAVESSDIIFAVDSIPAIFAITPDPFIVYTSNIFAMLGLRSLYFAVARFMRMFHFLHYGFASIIIILGAKMLLSRSGLYDVPVALSLGLIVVILLLCVIVSLLWPRKADLKLMFERTERLGLIPFRSLLLIENVIDLGELKVRDAMRSREAIQTIQLRAPWEKNYETMRLTRYSRYPLLDGDIPKPIGIVHVKDLFFAGSGPLELKTFARPCREVLDDLPLEEVLARFQRRYDQMAIVVNATGDWIGVITIEDVIEELVGKIDDEFDTIRPGRSISLADALSPGRVVLDLEAQSMKDAICEMVERTPRNELPVAPELIIKAVLQREEALPTYVGNGLAMPHGRLDGIDKPVLFFARSDTGVPLETTNDRAELLFMLLTPRSLARMQPRILADIAGLFDSEYVTERLRLAKTPDAALEAIRAGLQVVLD